MSRSSEIQREAKRFAKALREAARRGIKQHFGWWASGPDCFCAGGAVARVVGGHTGEFGTGEVIVREFPNLCGGFGPYFFARMNEDHRLSFEEIAEFLETVPAWAWREWSAPPATPGNGGPA